MNPVERRLASLTAPWEDNDALGTPITVDGSPTVGIVNGRRVVLAGTNNYLGLTFDPLCIAAAADAARKYGTGTTGSRVANGTYPEHAALEEELRDFYGARSAIVFTTGYQANLGTIAGLADRDTVLLLDAQSHASIYDGAVLSGAETYRFKHNDVDDLAKRLRRLGERTANTLVITEGIYSMLGDTAPLAAMLEVTKAAGAAMLVDEAHAFGVLGKRGRGLAEREGVEDDVDVVVGTFSKSLGCVGGYAVSRKHDLSKLRAAARSYIFSASPTPSTIATARTALSILRARPELRERLTVNSERVYGALLNLGYELGPEVSPVIGAIVRDPDNAIAHWRFLLDQGVYVNLVAPPASPGNYCMLRCSLSAAHTDEQVETIIAGYRALKKRLSS
jgi:8-amino-7-oxononanoate synthase